METGNKNRKKLMNLREKLQRFMVGRNGMDQLGRFLSFLCCLFLVVSLPLGSSVFGTFFFALALVLLVYGYVRTFSKNLARRQEENRRYLALRDQVTGRLRNGRERLRLRRDYRFYRCPECRTMTRVPKGKGKLRITCPKCGSQFIRKS